MKTIYKLLVRVIITVMVVPSIFSCDEWGEIELDRYKIEMNANGGESTIKSKNYDFVWIDCVYTNDSIYTSSKTEQVDPDIKLVDAEWLKAYMKKSNTKDIYIKVLPNETGRSRRASLSVTNGNNFSDNVLIIQSAE